MAAIYDISIDQGTSFRWSISVNLNTDPLTPMDLTDYSVAMQVRPDYNKPALLSASTTLGNITFDEGDPTAGTIIVSFTPADTTPLHYVGDADTLDCVYDLEITSIAGTATRLVQGACSIIREVTLT